MQRSRSWKDTSEKVCWSLCPLLCSFLTLPVPALSETGHQAGQGFVLTQQAHYHQLILSLSSLQTEN